MAVARLADEDVERIARRVVELLSQESRVPGPGNGRRALSATELADEVLAALRAHGPLSANDVQDVVKRRRSAVRDALAELAETGRAVCADKAWSVARQATLGVTATESTESSQIAPSPDALDWDVHEHVVGSRAYDPFAEFA